MEQIVLIVSPILLICLGAVFLFLGYRLVKVVAVVNLAVLGAMVGHDVATALKVEQPLWGSAIGAVVLGLIAIPLLRAAVVVAVGALGALVGKSVWVSLGGDPPLQWAALAGGFIVGALMGLLCFRFIIIVTSSVTGSGLVVYGGASLVLRRMVGAADIDAASAMTVVACAGAFVVLFFLGVIAQYRGARRLKARPAADG